MITGADVIKSIRAHLIAEPGASWNVAVGGKTNRVYPFGVNLNEKKRPFLVVGLESSVEDPVETPNRQMTLYQIIVTCIAKAPTTTDASPTVYGPDELVGEARNSLTKSDIAIKSGLPGSPVTVDTRFLMEIEILDIVHHDIADQYGRYAKELTGFLGVYQDRT
jgi:hypothetical protein